MAIDQDYNDQVLGRFIRDLDITPAATKACLRYLIAAKGDKPDRPGLIDTPDRIMQSWEELYEGNQWDEERIQKMMTTFDGIKYDGIVLSKDIEFYSFCEHHDLPFFGKAHIAYIPGKCPKKDSQGIPTGLMEYRVVGLSKLARLLDAKSRKLQVQETLTIDITDSLEKYLKPWGAACLIEAKHFCVCARGVGKQHSEMVTSSMTGTFLEGDGSSREELYSMIYGRR